MKCVDCLPLLEEFFDGEVDDKTSAQVREHLAACGECAEAFDALRAEQEMFLRYDRELEVTPALWEGVRAAIAAEAATEVKPPVRPFLTGLREQLAAAFALFAARPALASSLALLALGVTAGALWYANSVRPSGIAPTEVADNNPGARNAPTTNDTTNATSNPTPTVTAQINNDAAPTGVDKGDAGGAHVDRRADRTTTESAAARPRTEARRETTGVVVSFENAVHAVPADDTLPVVASSSRADEDVADASVILDPEDEAVARHVERAQMLLRSVKNARGDNGETDLAYERGLSRKLLEENISLQLDADADNNKKAQRVLKELEPYLNDIANLRDKPARGELRSIKERMEKQEIIAALHVYDD